MTKAILCSRDGKAGWADLKQVHNFGLFLRGKGTRCPTCLHKAKRHALRCGVKACNCNMSRGLVRRWWAAQSKVRAREG